MFRLIGFVLGVAIATIVLTNWFDAPSSSGFRETAEQLLQRGTTQPNELPPNQETSLPKQKRGKAPPESPNAVARDDATHQTPTQTEILTTLPQPEEVSGSEAQANASIVSWHAVWKPFRSQLAANGFAERLGRLTEREYRVRRLSVGAYQVEVGYDPHSGVADTLMQIRMVTGLRVKEPQP